MGCFVTCAPATLYRIPNTSVNFAGHGTCVKFSSNSSRVDPSQVQCMSLFDSKFRVRVEQCSLVDRTRKYRVSSRKSHVRCSTLSQLWNGPVGLRHSKTSWNFPAFNENLILRSDVEQSVALLISHAKDLYRPTHLDTQEHFRYLAQRAPYASCGNYSEARSGCSHIAVFHGFDRFHVSNISVIKGQRKYQSVFKWTFGTVIKSSNLAVPVTAP